MLQAEFETKLNRVYLHIYRENSYEEDYQMPMLHQNKIPGLLTVNGCEIEGKSRYTYEASGLISMTTRYEKVCIRKEEIQKFITEILEMTERLQEYMLNPGCLILEPEYIFYGRGGWHFCYLPDLEKSMDEAFHKLTEYFVKLLDYEDTEGIFLAYELHKATLQEHYDLRQIMRKYEIHAAKRKKVQMTPDQRKRERKRANKGWTAEKSEEQSLEPELTFGTSDGNIFYLTEEDTRETKNLHTKKSQESKRRSQGCTKKESGESEIGPADERKVQMPEMLREEGGWWKSWRKTANGIRRKRWGNWEDLILETDE